MLESIDTFDTVDNPGGGDCAFYAFAISLMHYIKTHRNSHAVYDKMQLNEERRQYVYNQITQFKLRKKGNSQSLVEMKNLMRNLLIDKYILDLEQALYKAFNTRFNHRQNESQKIEERLRRETCIKGNRLYTFFAQMVNQKTASSMHAGFADRLGIGRETSNEVVNMYNPLSGDSSVEACVNQVVRNIINLRKTSYYLNQNQQSKAAMEDALILQGFLVNITDCADFDRTPAIILKDSSIIERLKSQLAKETWWGTEEDLFMLAEYLGFEIIIWRDRKPVYFKEQFPNNALHILNLHRGHWVSLLSKQPERPLIIKTLKEIKISSGSEYLKNQSITQAKEESGAERQLLLTMESSNIWQIVALYMVINKRTDNIYLNAYPTTQYSRTAFKNYVNELKEQHPEVTSPDDLLNCIDNNNRASFQKNANGYQFSQWIPHDECTRYTGLIDKNKQQAIREALLKQLKKYQVAWYDPRQFRRSHIWRVDVWIERLESRGTLVNIEHEITQYIRTNCDSINQKGLFIKLMNEYQTIKSDILGSSINRELIIKPN